MFDWLKRLFFAPKDRVPLDPDRVDKLSLEDWGMGEIPSEVEGMGIAQAHIKAAFEKRQADIDSLGGYGGPCIPGDDLPDSIPRTGEPPTYAVRDKSSMNYATMYGDPGDTAKFNFNKLEAVKNPDNTRAASITNGYDRDILLEGPMLKLFVKKGETRTVKGPIFQRVPRAIRNGEDFNPSAFDVVGVAAIDVLRDMAAERTRSIYLGGGGTLPIPADMDFERACVDDILSLSKFTVTELPDEKSTPVRTSDPSRTAGQDGRGKEGDAGAPPVP